MTMPDDAPSRFVGVDVGGTNIVAAVVSADGTVIARFKQDTRRGAPGEELGGQIADAVEAALSAAACSIGDIGGVGIAVPGVVDSETGRIVVLPNLGIRDVPLREEMMTRFSVPVVVGNDVNLGTLAEVWIGAARGVQDVVGVFVGTGIGGGVVIDGRLRTGASEQAGEVGHMTVQLDGPVCGCGNRGCWEALASRTAIERDLRAAVEAGETCCVCPDGKCASVIKSSALKKALAAADPVATRVLRRAAEVLGIGAVTIRHLVDPQMIVFGGGVIEACGDFMLPVIREVIASDKLNAARQGLRVERSQLGDDALFLGAVALLLADLDLSSGAASIVEDQSKPCGEGKRQGHMPAYPRVRDLKFGSVRVGDARFESDVWVFADGTAQKRKKKLAKAVHGTSHVIDVPELQVLLEPVPEALVIGTGVQGAAHVSPGARAYLDELRIQWQALPSERAIAAYNEAKGRKALLLHVTC
jgi:glucokinase